MRALEDQEGMSSEDIKYVINMVLSAVDLEKLDDEDKDEILTKLEGDEESFNGEDSFNTPDGEEGMPSPESEIPPTEDELGEVYNSLEDLTSTEFDFDFDDEDEDDFQEYETDYPQEDSDMDKYFQNKYETDDETELDEQGFDFEPDSTVNKKPSFDDLDNPEFEYKLNKDFSEQGSELDEEDLSWLDSEDGELDEEDEFEGESTYNTEEPTSRRFSELDDEDFSWLDKTDDEGDDEMRDEVFLYIQELASQYPFVNWYFDGARL